MYVCLCSDTTCMCGHMYIHVITVYMITMSCIPYDCTYITHTSHIHTFIHTYICGYMRNQFEYFFFFFFFACSFKVFMHLFRCIGAKISEHATLHTCVFLHLPTRSKKQDVRKQATNTRTVSENNI